MEHEEGLDFRPMDQFIVRRLSCDEPEGPTVAGEAGNCEEVLVITTGVGEPDTMAAVNPIMTAIPFLTITDPMLMMMLAVGAIFAEGARDGG